MSEYLSNEPMQLNSLGHLFRGIAIGLAEVVPGVSGGTIAFITNIYERLLNVIANISPKLIHDYRSGGIRAIWVKLDGPFISTLILGMAFGIIIGVFGLTWLLENYPPVVWAFFFGLIISSSIFIFRKITHWNPVNILSLAIGVISAYWISTSIPIQTEPSFIYLFFSGAIAISALILPGISGSFILLLLGMYTIVIPGVKELLVDPISGPWLTIIPFAVGCAVGIVSIARLLSWTFKNYQNQTLAILTGFMLGSLVKLWPWRNIVQWINKEDNSIMSETPAVDMDTWEPLVEKNVLPAQYIGEPYFVAAIIACIAGIALLIFMETGRRNR